MQPEIKKAAPGTSGTATDNCPIMDQPSLSVIPHGCVVLNISDKICIHSPDKDLVSKIIQVNTFRNPKHEANELRGYSNWQTSRTIETFHRHEDGTISVSRGFLPELLTLCEEFNLKYSIEDRRVESPVTFPILKGVTLRPYQEEAISKAMKSEQGVLVSPTGSGKSLMGLDIIRRRGQKTLIIVHRSDLARQWIEKIHECMGIEAGFIGEGQWTIGDQITVAMVQTIAAKGKETQGFSNAFGLILLDEVHHAPASTFFDVLGLLPAKYRLGLSATPSRRDGLEKMIYRAIGPAIAIISKEEVEGVGATVPAAVISIETGFNPGFVDSWAQYLDSLTATAERNVQIINLAQQAEGAVLILVDRIAHAEQLSEMLSRRNIDHVLAHGKIQSKDRKSVMDRIKSAKLTVGTTSLLGEGLDVSVWSVLIMGAPISSEIKLMQAIGRIVRPSPGKIKALVYDLKDDCGFSGSSFNKRFEIYRKHKIWVQFKSKKIEADAR